MRAWAFSLGAIGIFVSQTALAATYVVAPDGDDNNAGDAANPWATLQHAADTVQAGDTVIVEPGDYQGFYVAVGGTAGAPITFSAKPGVAITSENPDTPDGINVEGGSPGEVGYVIIEGFTVNNMARAGIRTAVTDHVTIRKNKMDQNGSWGILTGFAEDVLIEDNECSRSQDEHGIYVGNSADRPVIRRNVCWGNNANGIHMNGDASLGGDGVISNALVEANILFDNGSAGGSGINCDGVSDSVIQNNLIYDTHASGISLYQIDGGEASQNNVVVNNTVLVASDGRWALNIRDGAVNNHAYNNVLWNAHPSRGAIDIAPDALTGFLSDNNVMIDRFTADDGNSILTLAEWQAQTGQDANSSTDTPVFVDAAGDDYHPDATSPTVDKGTSTEAPGEDLDGVGRPQGAAFDVGAYEFCAGECGPVGTGGGGAGGNTGGSGQGGSGAGPGVGGNGSGAGAGQGDGGNGASGATDAGADFGGCGCRIEGGGARDAEAGLFAGLFVALAMASRRCGRRAAKR